MTGCGETSVITRFPHHRTHAANATLAVGNKSLNYVCVWWKNDVMHRDSCVRGLHTLHTSVQSGVPTFAFS